MSKLNKPEMIELVQAQKGGSKKDAEASLDAVLGAFAVAFANGDDVSLNGFGNFEVRERSAGKGINPKLMTDLVKSGVSKEDARAQATIDVPARKTVVATLSPKIKDLPNQ